MAITRADRRLAAILAADVVGYARLMERDETGTVERLKDHRKSLIEPLVAEHHGRIVKLMGDGALCEFGSVVDAVQCAVLIQQGMAEREADTPEDQRIRFRIGINLGDVIYEDDDLFGDGVNIAARLEGLAEPGGILISGTAYDQVEGKLPLALAFVGEQRVKNIERSVRTYRIDLAGSPKARGDPGRALGAPAEASGRRGRRGAPRCARGRWRLVVLGPARRGAARARSGAASRAAACEQGLARRAAARERGRRRPAGAPRRWHRRGPDRRARPLP